MNFSQLVHVITFEEQMPYTDIIYTERDQVNTKVTGIQEHYYFILSFNIINQNIVFCFRMTI
jgi:hypothetical protein